MIKAAQRMRAKGGPGTKGVLAVGAARKVCAPPGRRVVALGVHALLDLLNSHKPAALSKSIPVALTRGKHRHDLTGGESLGSSRSVE